MKQENWDGEDFNEREEEAAQWAEQIMVAERKEQLLQQYYSTDELWLYHRLCEALEDCLYHNPSSGLMSVITPKGHHFEPEFGMYGQDFKVGLDLSDPYFALGGVILGHIATFPQYAVAFGSDLNPVQLHDRLKMNKEHFPQVCNWKIADNCENRHRFILAFPLGNRIVYFSTCYPCANELPNRI